jgi:hypothetical protein
VSRHDNIKTIRTWKIRCWEAENRRSILEAIPTEINAAGSIVGAAQRMDVSVFTLRDWIKRLGIRVTTSARVLDDQGNAQLPAAG